MEKMDNKSGTSTPAVESSSSSMTRRVISFEKNDPENPTQWHWVSV